MHNLYLMRCSECMLSTMFYYALICEWYTILFNCRINEKPVKSISCYSLNDSPVTPAAQQEFEQLLTKQTLMSSVSRLCLVSSTLSRYSKTQDHTLYTAFKILVTNIFINSSNCWISIQHIIFYGF